MIAVIAAGRQDAAQRFWMLKWRVKAAIMAVVALLLIGIIGSAGGGGNSGKTSTRTVATTAGGADNRKVTTAAKAYRRSNCN